MDDAGLVRLGRELFMVALGLPIQDIDSWALDRMIAMVEGAKIVRRELTKT